HTASSKESIMPLRTILAVLGSALVGIISMVGFTAAADDDAKYDQSKVPLEVLPEDAALNKIVIVAGRQSHGPGDHEFFAGCALLADLLKQTPDVWVVIARDGWPKNEKIFDGAAALVFYMDGRGGYPVVVKDKDGDRMDRIQ